MNWFKKQTGKFENKKRSIKTNTELVDFSKNEFNYLLKKHLKLPVSSLSL